MRRPSVKGDMIEPVLDELRARLEQGSLSRERIEVALEPADIALLDDKIRPTRWYPMATWGRIVELLAETAGTGRIESLLERGARAARGLVAEAGGGSFESLRDELGEHPDAASAWVAGTLLREAARQHSCGRWTWLAGAPGSGSYEISVDEAGPLPECLRVLVEVTLRRLHAEFTPAGRRVESERPEPGRIVFRVA
jgi:hypothetical protein